MDNGIKVIFFDMGYTLIDETYEHLRRYHLLQTVFPIYGIKAKSDEEFMMEVCEAGKKHSAPIWNVVRKWGLPKEITTPYNNDDEKLLQGIPEALRALKEHYRLGIIANQHKGAADRLRGFGIYEYFEPDLIFGSEDVGFKKPDTRLFKAALDASGVVPAETLMVGDRPDNDIAPAAALGMKTARVRQGYNYMMEIKGCPKPDYDVADVAALAEILIK